MVAPFEDASWQDALALLAERLAPCGDSMKGLSAGLAVYIETNDVALTMAFTEGWFAGHRMGILRGADDVDTA